MLTEPQFRLNTLPSLNGFSALHFVFGSDPADLSGWQDGGDDLLFARETSNSGQVVQQWKLRMMAQEPALEGMANGKWRRLLARKRSFVRAGVKVEDSAL